MVDSAKRREFGLWIRGIRKDRGISLRQASEKMGYHTRGLLGGVESGNSSLPVERIFDVVKLYDLSLEEILDKLAEYEPEIHAKFCALQEQFEVHFFREFIKYSKRGNKAKSLQLPHYQTQSNYGAKRHHASFPSAINSSIGKSKVM